MATFIQGQPSSKKSQRSQTLEDVAEEMLNGMFCHYEPPRRRKNGILRGPRNIFRRNNSKSVRWVDEPNKPAPVEIRCNVASNCVDAAVEAGLISPTKKVKTEELLAKYDYDLPKRKSSEAHNKDVIFDDDGNPVSTKTDQVAPPPPPPPPARRERFIPELCGVRINCLEDEEQLAELAKMDAENKHRRPRQPFDYNDEENSLLEGHNYGNGAVFREKLRAQEDWETESSSARGSRFKWPLRRRGSWSGSQTGLEIDPVEMARDGYTKAPKSPLAFLKARSPRSRKSKLAENDDWDDSVPIIPPKSPRRWSLGGRKQAGLDSRSKEDRRRSFDPRSLVKSPSNASESRNDTLPRPRSRSLDRDDAMERQSDITAHRRAFEAPVLPHPGLHPAHPLNQQYMVAASRNVVNDNVERQSYITAHRQNFNDVQNTNDHMERQSYITAHRHGFDTLQQDDRMERNSAITDHRKLYEQQPTRGRSRSKSPSRRTQSPRRSRSPGVRPHSPYNRSRSFENDPNAIKAESQSMVMGSMPGGYPPMPSAQSHSDPPLHGEPIKEGKPEVLVKESEMTWEERTRIAWERLRSGMGLDTVKEEDDVKEEDTNKIMQSPSFPRERPTGILRGSSYERKVSFGQNEERVYHNTDEESLNTHESSVSSQNPRNQSPNIMLAQQNPPHMVIKGSPSKKTKKVFRGSKILKGLFGKGKQNMNRRRSFDLTASRSMDLTASVSRSHEWEDSHSMDHLPNGGSYPVHPHQYYPGPTQSNGPATFYYVQQQGLPNGTLNEA